MVFSVAMNSKKHALVALLIASNFVEIKGTIFKKYDSHKLWALTCQDIVERAHLLAALAFVAAEDMRDRSAGAPDTRLLRHCGVVYGSEVVIDIIKHVVLGKLNDMRPGVYREFMKDLCEQVYHTPSHDMHRVLGFVPFSVAALCLRIAIGALQGRRHPSDGSLQPPRVLGLQLGWAGVLLLGWALLAPLHLLLGYHLKRAAAAYLRHYARKRAAQRDSSRRLVSRIRTEPASAAADKLATWQR